MVVLTCQTENCINEMSTVGALGLVVLPHPVRDNCRERGFPNGTSGDRNVPVRPLRDDPVITNRNGGSQSAISEVFTTLPLNALSALSKLQRLGDERYGPHNWRSIPESDHIDHAFAHMLGHCTGDQTEDHLLHAAWRLVAALEVRLTRSTAYEEDSDD